MKAIRYALIIILLLLLLILLFAFIRSKQENKTTKGSELFLNITGIYYGLPEQKECDQLIDYPGFVICYNEKTEQANWTAHILSKKMLQGPRIKRKDLFKKDNRVLTGTAIPEDYKRSGYDKGHLVPAADMAWSEASSRASFYMSNMSPQLPGFNRGIWKRTEEWAREMALIHDSLYIISGPVFKDESRKIGINEVYVPSYYYKIVMDITQPEYSAIAFLFQNEAKGGEIYEYAITIDSLERFTGVDFFYELKGEMIEKLEQELQIGHWIK